jgi:hypothetical protein
MPVIGGQPGDENPPFLHILETRVDIHHVLRANPLIYQVH